LPSRLRCAAYDDNQTILNHVKQVQQDEKDGDHSYMTLAVSLLNVGVAGTAAGAFARYVLETERKNATLPHQLVERILVRFDHP